MLRCMLIVGIVCTFLSGCAYNPIIDTAGKSGTFNTDQAKEITNDIQHCKTLVAEHSNVIEDMVFWVFSPDSETKSTQMTKLCLKNRGHSVIK